MDATPVWNCTKQAHLRPLDCRGLDPWPAKPAKYENSSQVKDQSKYRQNLIDETKDGIV